MSVSSGNYQRDVRIHNNFVDPQANNNNVPQDDYPGALGAELAVWRSAVAWGSSTSTASKNFDFDWQGTASGVGGRNDNIVSALPGGCSGNTLAFTEGPISNGWRIRFCENIGWDDGPGNPVGVDLEGVNVHELGHALGLGHSDAAFCGGSCFSRATMCAIICGDGQTERSIAENDADRLQSLYGAFPGNKPVITGISGSFETGGTLIIDGTDFASNVHVKFTAGTGQNSGTIPGVVYNRPSTNGGTRVQVTIPNTASTGNVMIWQPNQNRLSNYFPIYIDENPPSISGINPTAGPIQGGTEVTISGSDFFLNASVTMGGESATVLSRSSGEIVIESPQGSTVGAFADVTVSQGTGSDTLSNAFMYEENPVFLTWDGNPRVGGNVTIKVTGPQNLDVAVAVGQPGLTERLGIPFCVVGPFPFVKKFPAGLNTGSLGAVETVWQGVQGTVFETVNVVGVIKLGPGTFQDLGCVPLTILP